MDLNKVLKEPICFKIISFFHENPMSIDTPRGVAAWVGEDRQNVNKALLELSKLKLLTAHAGTSTMGYSYTRDTKMIKSIEKSLKRLKKEEAK